MKAILNISIIICFGLSQAIAQNPSFVSTNAPDQMTVMGGHIYFSENGELRSIAPDGTISGDLSVGSPISSNIEVMADKIYYQSQLTASHTIVKSYSPTTGTETISNALYPAGVPVESWTCTGSNIYIQNTIDDVLYKYDGAVLTTIGSGYYEGINGCNVTLSSLLLNSQKSATYLGVDYYGGSEFYSFSGPTVPTLIADLNSTTGDACQTLFSNPSKFVVHDGKLFFTATSGTGTYMSGGTYDIYNIYSFDGTTVSMEVAAGTNPGVYSAQFYDENRADQAMMYSHDGDLYYIWSFFSPDPLSSGVELRKYDGTTSTSVEEIFNPYFEDSYMQLSEVDGDLYFSDIALFHYDGLIPPDGYASLCRLEEGTRRYITTGELASSPTDPDFGLDPLLSTAFDGALYYYSVLGDGVSGPGIYRYDPGAVVDIFNVTATSICDPIDNTFDITVEVGVHGSLGGGTYAVEARHPDGVTIHSFTFAETGPLTTFILTDIPTLHPLIDGDTDYEVEITSYTNPTDPYERLFEIGLDDDVTSPTPCDLCSLVVTSTDQTCTSEGVYTQELTIDWDTDRHPLPIDIEVNGTVHSVSTHPFVVSITDLTGDGSDLPFDVSMPGYLSSETCTTTEMITTPDCACSMTWEYGDVISCDPGMELYSQEFTLFYDLAPAGGILDFGEFTAPATGSPQMVVFSDLPAEGSPFSGFIVFVGSEDCGVEVEWMAPNPDCSMPVDCPALLGNIGEPCDDMDPGTEFDTIQADCSCAGIDSDCADNNGDGVVDIDDFLNLNSVFGSSCTGCPEDGNGDGVVDINDFLDLNSQFGTSCDGLVGPPDHQHHQILNTELTLALERLELSTLDPALKSSIDAMHGGMAAVLLSNPTDGQSLNLRLQIDRQLPTTLNATVNDIWGRVIITQTFSIGAKNSELNWIFERSLSSGVYLLQIESEVEQVTKRFIVE